MFKQLLITLAIFFSCFILSLSSYGWGEWGHQHINRASVFALPQPMRSFYFNHIDFITTEASIPDVRKYAINAQNEFKRHFIDLENFGCFNDIPRDWDTALLRYGKDMLNKEGILPWYIQKVTKDLTEAFKKKDKILILFLSADLAHYIGDAYQPLHTTINYDGQLTKQKGVHAFFESYLPEQFGSSFNFYVPNVKYVDNLQESIWSILEETHPLVDTVLNIEKRLLNRRDSSRIFVMNEKGEVQKNKYYQPRFQKDFAQSYFDHLNGQIESQMRKAVQITASFWYTAWVDAGKPDLNSLDDPYSFKAHKKALRKEYKLWSKKGKLIGLKAPPEF